MATDNSTLFFFSEEQTKTFVDALISAYGAADLHARSMQAAWEKKCAEVEELKTKLEEAEKRLVVLDTAYNDMDDERDEWKQKYTKLNEEYLKMLERKGQ